MSRRPLSSKPSPPANIIQVRGVHQNNLKGFDLDIPLYQLNVVTGPSGSGKSSLAFDTIYAEGQRRYVETFSPYTRQFFERMDKPKVDAIHGIPPAIAIEQVNNIRSTRSTVGTITELNDYLKMLFPRLAKATCPSCQRPVQPDTPDSIQHDLLHHHADTTALITFAIPVPSDTNTADFFTFLQSQGYTRVLLFGEVIRTDEPQSFKKKLPAQVQVIQDRIQLAPTNKPRLIEALEVALHFGKGTVAIALTDLKSQILDLKSFSTTWHCAHCDLKLPAPTPGLFSFNNPVGACPTCRGFGRTLALDLTKAMPDESLSINEGLVKAFTGDTYAECQQDLVKCAKARHIDLNLPFEDYTKEDRQWLIEGDNSDPEEAYRNGEWYGIRGFFKWQESRAYKMHVRIFLSRYRAYTECPDCLGSRLKIEASFFNVEGKTLHDLWQLPVSELLPYFETLPIIDSDKAARMLRDEIVSRLSYMERAGLTYLNLDRQTRTLSGGELQRVNLTTCLGASLVNTLFVLDEPSIGLHPRDIGKLIGVMEGLRDKGNTLLVVEHEEAVMRAADNLIEIGPGRGEKGGHLVFHGPLTDLHTKVEGSSRALSSKKPKARDLTPTFSSLTGDYLYGIKTIPVPTTRRQPKPGQHIRIKGARQNNLKNLNVDIPLGLLCAVTGVSGSGKSTLIHDVLYNNLLRQRGEATEDEPGKVKSIDGIDKVGTIVMVDQSPLARTPRSTPAVYIGAFDLIRQLFAETPDGKADNLTPGFFSFNSGNGRCERCMGNGFEKIEMQFLSDLYVSCPECEGKRYQTHALKYQLNGKNIHDVLNLTIEDAIEFFSSLTSDTGLQPVGGTGILPVRQGAQVRSHPQPKPSPFDRKLQSILAPLHLLTEAGLSYLRLGQPLNTLSGGEAQRLKLIGHLLEPSSEQNTTLFLLDEPTTGLHFDDIALLVKLLQRLTNEGHSILVIEHNLEVIKCADWVIDLGPEAGSAGGELVAVGPPELIAQSQTSWTGKYLTELLNPSATFREQPAKYRPQTLNPQLSTLNSISVSGAREHNLKNISVNIPRDELVVVTGLSGSGKSSLAFDLIFAEGQRRFLDSMSVYARTFVEQMEKPDVDLITGVPPTVAIEQRVSRGSGKSTVATVTEIYHFLRLLFSKVGTQYCPDCHIPVEKQSVNAIVNLVAKEAKTHLVHILAPLIKARKGFHTDIAEAAAKQGIETLLVDGKFKDTANFQKLERFKEHTIDAVVAQTSKNIDIHTLRPIIERALKLGKGTLKLRLPDQSIHILNTQMSCPQCSMSFEELDPRLFSFNSPHGWCTDCRGFGVITSNPGSDQKRDDISQLEAELEEERKFDSADHSTEPCPTCHGSRLNRIARSVRLKRDTDFQSVRETDILSVTKKKSANTPPSPQSPLAIGDLATLSAERAAALIATLTFTGTEAEITRDILTEIKQRLHFMQEVGLGYLQLGRSADTLSGGEAQRIRLSAQLGSNLRGVLYVLDEPTIGLHPRDNQRLLNTLLALRDKGNSLLVVEHDEETMRAADTILDLGPGAGRYGGEIIAQGNLAHILKHKTSVTGKALREPMIHPLHGKRRPLPKPNAPDAWLTLENANNNNLKNLTLKIPLARLTVLTGVSGSGKSTLMRAALHPAVKEALAKPTKAKPKSKNTNLTGSENLASVYEVDQSPIGKTSRSCPATYVGVLDDIRKLFAQLPTARARGFGPGRFSFNTEGGRCESCQGNGEIKVEMNFLPSTRVHCETCNGLRFNAATMEVTYNSKNIGEVLKMSITEAAEFFSSLPKIARPLQLLADTGVGYLQLGQPSPTLSGGESQRLKLVTELQAGQGRTITDKMRGLKTTKRNLYLIEEPTIGLHANDVARLIDILHRLVDEGHTVVVIEHELNVIAEADNIIDIGPEAGERGGQIVAQGPPEKVAQSKTSHTAPFLKAML
ncbi:excinuclease ABC subunit A [Phragmitibacter flavus]|uniref:UvrABC system protein A n=1 Tax=Phragmitibacter flavus TaxID=2576071 RepID=A0A5R8KAW5_9BACT|nr:excinuclease ABC subunit UvrA [Phragmitibacter flavus]TLD69453.1 excinuclease ABC subunit A [Phragmitibacter flavus]